MADRTIASLRRQAEARATESTTFCMRESEVEKKELKKMFANLKIKLYIFKNS